MDDPTSGAIPLGGDRDHSIPSPGPRGHAALSPGIVARHRDLLAASRDVASYARGLVSLVKDLSGCTCAGLRRVGRSGFLPFVASVGFSDRFLQVEEGVAAGVEDCACVRLLAGREVPSCLHPVPGDGCSRACPDLDAATRDAPQDRLAFRSRCLDEGFRTFAVFPLEGRDGAGALLQVADARPGALSPDAARAVAALAPLVGDALRCLRAEESLARERRAVQSLSDSLPLPLWIVGADRRIVYQNRAHVAAFEQAPQGAICHKFLWNRDAPCPSCALDRVLAGEPVRDAWKAPRTGRIFDVLSLPYDHPSGPAMTEILMDATDRVHAESALRQAQRMESLGSLAAGIAHDFNNILAGVSGYAQLGEQRAVTDPALAQPFQQIRAIADRGAELTRKILAFSRSQPMKIVPVDLNEMVRALQPMLQPLAGDLVEIRLALSPGIWAVLGDRGALDQALFNLCANAVEAMASGGTLTISTANVPPEMLERVLGNDRPMNGVVLKVVDTGCGMTREVADRIFEPFYTTKGRGRGTGLGLSVTYGIVRQLGGAITVDTAVGRGTTMSLYLPSTTVTPSRVVRPKEVVEIPPEGYKGRAVVVEDEAAIRDLVSEMLGRMGFDVVRVPTADEAMRLVLSSVHGFDLVVSDVAMPGMNGCDLARRIASLRPSTAVLLMTGCSDEHLAQYGVSDTMHVLRKPFDLDTFASRIDELVGSLRA